MGECSTEIMGRLFIFFMAALPLQIYQASHRQCEGKRSFYSSLPPLTHSLSLSLSPHPQFCGEVIAGISLLSPSVMVLEHKKDPTKWIRALLPQLSLYVMRYGTRTSYNHVCNGVLYTLATCPHTHTHTLSLSHTHTHTGMLLEAK